MIFLSQASQVFSVLRSPCVKRNPIYGQFHVRWAPTGPRLSYLYCLVITLSRVIASPSSEPYGNLIVHIRLPRHPSRNITPLDGNSRGRGLTPPALLIQSIARLLYSILLISLFPGQPSIVPIRYNTEDLPCRFLRSSLL